MIDESVLRSGRFGTWIEVPLPSREGLIDIFKLSIRKLSPSLASTVDPASFVDRMKGFSGADIAALMQKAQLKALRELYTIVGEEEKETETTEAVGVGMKRNQQLQLVITPAHLEEALQEVRQEHRR